MSMVKIFYILQGLLGTEKTVKSIEKKKISYVMSIAVTSMISYKISRQSNMIKFW